MSNDTRASSSPLQEGIGDDRQAAELGESARATGGNRRRLISRASGAMASQVCTAGGSLVLQLIAARTLGLAGYGAFALCLSLLTSATALYTGFVGDALTVLDRHDRAMRRGLATWAVMILVLCAAIAAVVVPILHLGGTSVAAIYAFMVFAWLLEETGRRVLMARLEFWQLVLNDAIYTGVTLIALVVLMVSGAKLTLFLLLASMAIGAIAAIITARIQLPAAEYARPSLGRGELGEVAGFAVWRSLQASLIPAQLLVARVLVLQLASITAVGAVEAGRLVVAPIQSVINGAGGFLLPTAAERERKVGDNSRRLAEAAVLILVAVTVLGGAGAALLANPLGRLMTGHPVSAMLVLGWTLYLVTWALCLPFITELVARKLTRQVFIIRIADSVIGVAAVAIGLGLGASPTYTPWLLSSGGVITVVLVRRLAIRTRPRPTSFGSVAAPSPVVPVPPAAPGTDSGDAPAQPVSVPAEGATVRP